MIKSCAVRKKITLADIKELLKKMQAFQYQPYRKYPICYLGGVLDPPHVLGKRFDMASFLKSYHEIWRTCKECGQPYDYRRHDRCPDCGSTKIL